MQVSGLKLRSESVQPYAIGMTLNMHSFLFICFVSSRLVLELAYFYSPTNMKGMCIGLVYAFQGVSAMLSIGIVAIIHHSKYGETLFFQNRSPGAVHYYFMILGGVILVGMLLFALAARRFKTVRVHVDLRS